MNDVIIPNCRRRGPRQLSRGNVKLCAFHTAIPGGRARLAESTVDQTARPMLLN
jgi:hypothetical protein